MSGEERRRSPRFVIDVAVVMIVAGVRKKARLRDVCRDAALVEVDSWEPLGTEVALDMELPDAPAPLQVTGRVIRLAPGEQGSHGIAILFLAPSPEVEAAIDAFVARQREP